MPSPDCSLVVEVAAAAAPADFADDDADGTDESMVDAPDADDDTSVVDAADDDNDDTSVADDPDDHDAAAVDADDDNDRDEAAVEDAAAVAVLPRTDIHRYVAVQGVAEVVEYHRHISQQAAAVVEFRR